MANNYSIELVELTAQPTLVIQSTVMPAAISERLAECFGRVESYIERAGGVQSGMPFVRYLDMRDDVFVIAAGMPLAEALEGEGGIEAHILPAGRALTTLHRGDYAGVGAAWEAVWGRAASLGVTRRHGGWGVYTNDPSEVTPGDLETRLYLPLDVAE